jgi:crotonobetainyl-CoA:carnitine CoA-transferase CaiB-like acyl-CoA transferase
VAALFAGQTFLGEVIYGVSEPLFAALLAAGFDPETAVALFMACASCTIGAATLASAEARQGSPCEVADNAPDLLDAGLSIEQIAAQVGYSSVPACAVVRLVKEAVSGAQVVQGRLRAMNVVRDAEDGVSPVTGDGPLAGVRVIDLTTTFMGPYCTQLLAGMGADVIKVEAPDGDITRRIGGGRNPDMGPIFLATNHGKRSIAVDLKRDEGRLVLDQLLAGADVFVNNLRPDAAGRLGLAADQVTARHPRLVYATLTGFGATGPYRDHAAYDDIIQALCGLAAVQSGGGEPTYVRSAVADKITGIMASSAILAALLARGTTGRGQAVEVPMFETMAQFLLLEQQGGHLFEPPTGPTGYVRTASPDRRPYRTADGYLGVVVYTDRQWLAFFDLIGRPELARDPRFATVTGRTTHVDELYGLVAAVLPGRTSEQWLKDLQPLGIPCAPVLDLDDLLTDEHLLAVEFFRRFEHPTEGTLNLPRPPMRFSTQPTGPGRPAPLLGEHGPDLLRELGYPDDEVRRLTDTGVLHHPGTT